MIDIQQYYQRSDGKDALSLNEIEQVTIKYVRNLKLGFAGTVVTIDHLKRWFLLDQGLTEFPTDVILQRWLDEWTPSYLAKWSYKNDHINKTRDN